MRRASIFAVVGVLLLAGCGGEDGGATTASQAGIEGTWRATSLSAAGKTAPPLPGSEITAEFGADGELTGSAGCNGYGGSYETDGSAISIGTLSATKKACADPGVMDQELDFLTALPQATEFRVGAGELMLLAASGKALARFEPLR